jgi:hypothetical protein
MGPEVTIIVFPFALACRAVWLTRESACKDVDLVGMCCEIRLCNIVVTYGIGPVMVQYLTWELRPLAVELVIPSHPLGGKVKTANA